MTLKRTRATVCHLKVLAVAHVLRRSLISAFMCQVWGLAQGCPTGEGQVGPLSLANPLTTGPAGIVGTCPAVLGSQNTLEQ